MLLRQLTEADGKTAVFAFGRMNPPTIGHAKLADVVKQQPGTPFLFLTHTQKPKTDPLTFAEKVFFARKCFGENISIGHDNVRTIIDAMKFLYARKFTDIIYVAGDDRVNSFNELLNKYNGGDDYTFNSINVVSAGQRDPDADGAEGMSATKMKNAAAENDLQTFKSGVCSTDPKVARMLFNKVRAGMGIQDEAIQVIESEAKFYDNLYNKLDGVWFRGEGQGGQGLGLGALGKGTYLTWTENAAKAFSIHHGSDGEVVKYKVKPGLKIADYQSDEVADIKQQIGFKPWEYSGDQMYSAILTMDLQKAGYDGCISDKEIEGLVIFDKSNVTRAEGEPNS
ncbi:MAG: hypothetical protein CMA31_00860 [Euryarchaeota archaeon]|nr:hypothetical protein [Euryarchaeota archaeon]